MTLGLLREIAGIEMRFARSVTVLFSLLVLLSATHRAASAQESKRLKVEVKVTTEDQTLLRRLKRIEDGAKMMKGALAVGVFKDLVVGDSAEKVYAIYDADWDLFVEALKATRKIHMCQSKTVIVDYLVLEKGGVWPNTQSSKL